MRMTTMVMAALAATCGAAASGQELVHWTLPVPSAQGQYSYFPMGTPLRLTTRSELSTQANRPGDRFYMVVAEPLISRGQVVVPAGSIAAGEVMRVQHTGAMGRRGELAIRPLYVQTPSGPIRLSGHTDRSGKGQQVLAIGGAMVVAWPMIFIHGTSARLPADSSVNAVLAEDLRFPVAPVSTAAKSVSGTVASVTPPTQQPTPTTLAANR